jgi:hypothetical protein
MNGTHKHRTARQRPRRRRLSLRALRAAVASARSPITNHQSPS